MSRTPWNKQAIPFTHSKQRRAINKVDSQVELSKDCKGYEAFKQDINKLKLDNTGSGLSAIVANTWLKKICELPQSALVDYVDQYKAGLLNAWYAYK